MTMGELATVAGTQLRGDVPEILPLVIDAIQDGGSQTKRLVAVSTLGQVSAATSLAVFPPSQAAGTCVAVVLAASCFPPALPGLPAHPTNPCLPACLRPRPAGGGVHRVCGGALPRVPAAAGGAAAHAERGGGDCAA